MCQCVSNVANIQHLCTLSSLLIVYIGSISWNICARKLVGYSTEEVMGAYFEKKLSIYM